MWCQVNLTNLLSTIFRSKLTGTLCRGKLWFSALFRVEYDTKEILFLWALLRSIRSIGGRKAHALELVCDSNRSVWEDLIRAEALGVVRWIGVGKC